jgi:tetratricopeptide (TPR) repeat protein
VSARVAFVVGLAMVAGCGSAPVVDRSYGGRVVHGRYLEPEAYAAFLRGAIAFDAGDVRGALAAYAQAAELDPDSPEIATRIGEARCRADPRDSSADAAFEAALKAEPRYARAWEARARCALARGDEPGARQAALRAAAIDPSADGASILVARTTAAGADGATRASLVALTATSRDPLVAWDALAGWAEGSGDVALWAQALRQVAKLEPTRRDAIARASQRLAGLGEIGSARAVAAAAVDASPQPLAAEGLALAARLAVDEAIVRADADTARRRSTRARVPLEETAGRAWLAGQRGIAHDLATAVAAADPTARGARLLLAAESSRDVAAAASDARAGDSPASAASFVAFGIALVRVSSADQVRAALGAVSHDAAVQGDDPVERAQVDLASTGALVEGVLDADAAVELAARRGQALPDDVIAARAPALDPRHEYLALSVAHPGSAREQQLGALLARVSASDPIVAAAKAFERVAVGAAIDRGEAAQLLERAPADPLVAAAALRLAEKVGDADAAKRARATLMALGGGAGHVD